MRANFSAVWGPYEPRVCDQTRLSCADHGPALEMSFFFLTVFAGDEKEANIWLAIFFRVAGALSRDRFGSAMECNTPGCLVIGVEITSPSSR